VRFETVVTSLLSLLLGFFLLFLGICFFVAPAYPDAAGRLLTDIVLNSKKAYTIGVVLIGFSLILWSICASLTRRKYTLIRMGGFSLSARALQQVAQKALHAVFEEDDTHCVVQVSTFGKVELIAAVPYLEEELREDKLEQLENTLVAAFSSQCGFEKPFVLNVTFKNA
jgi:uncharacterized membrane protein